MNRRGFFGSALASAATALAVRLGRSDDSVPRRVDLRVKGTDWHIPLAVWLDGVPRKDVVAYDLDAQTITRYRKGPDGLIVFAPDDQWVTERGVLVVRWEAA
jgi:hypothetical protein